MREFERAFEDFCKSESKNSGKARSYTYAIRYLCEYMGIYVINDESIKRIKSVENNIRDKNSAFYKELLAFLSARGQKSYLVSGYIRAALKCFSDFYKQKC